MLNSGTLRGMWSVFPRGGEAFLEGGHCDQQTPGFLVNSEGVGRADMAHAGINVSYCQSCS